MLSYQYPFQHYEWVRGGSGWDPEGSTTAAVCIYVSIALNLSVMYNYTPPIKVYLSLKMRINISLLKVKIKYISDFNSTKHFCD